MKKPKTLQQAIIYFADADRSLDYMVKLRWPRGVICPTCGRTDARFLANQRKWQCKSVHPKRQFSAKVGTIFEDSPLGLDKWLTAVWMISSCKNGVSSYEIARAIGVTQKSAWFMLHRIRLAMQGGGFFKKKLGGFGREVEVDETFIGGAARFMHREKHARRTIARGPSKHMTPVMGILERGGKVRAITMRGTRKHQLVPQVIEHVNKGSRVYTDKLHSYDGLWFHGFNHSTVDHAEKYVDGQVHTNGLENFWSLVKRGLKGTYVSVEPFHLFRYLDEQVFRYNFRKLLHDGLRFERVLSHIIGKRLTYAQVTGKVCPTPA